MELPESLGDFEKYKERLARLDFSSLSTCQHIVQAFMFPAVRSSAESLEWGEYDKEKMNAFLQHHPSVNESRVMNIIQPALKKRKRESQLQYDFWLMKNDDM